MRAKTNYLIPTGLVSQPFSHILGTGGNDTGDMLACDGHGDPADYYVAPPTGQKWHVYRLLMSLEGEDGMEIEQYGDQTALVGGIMIIVSRAGVEQTLNALVPLKANWDFGKVGFDVKWEVHDGLKIVENERVHAELRFDDMGCPLVLFPGDKLIARFLLDSDTSGLYEHYWSATGSSHAYKD